MITTKTKSGVEISADNIEKIINLLQKIGEEIDLTNVYLSKTHGPMLISEMNDHHLKNAIFKLYQAWLDDIKKLSFDESLQNLVYGPGFSKPENQLYGLMHEAIKRYS